MSSLTRGPLPARVYWRRRLVLLTVALVLVFGIAKALGAGSDGVSGEDRATQVAAEPGAGVGTTSSGPTTGPTTGPTVDRAGARDGKQGKGGKPGKGRTGQAPVKPEPEGPCADEDVVVDPQVKDAVAGRDVTLKLHLRTRAALACTWHVSRSSLTVKITSGPDDIWSTRQCPRAVPEQDVVVRRDFPAKVELTWHGRRSDDECSRMAGWALPGYYHVVAAALAGEPADEQFELAKPTSQVITRSPDPHQHRDKDSGKHGSQKDGSQDDESEASSPSGSASDEG